MKNKRIVTLGQEGFPKKEVLNFDEETYSQLARPEFFPTSVKIPSEYVLERFPTAGHSHFVDEDNFLWCSNGLAIFKQNLSEPSEGFVNVIMASAIDAQAVGVDFLIRTASVGGNYNIIVFLKVLEGNAGGKVYTSSDNAVTWTKVIDLPQEGLFSHFRPSNVFYHKVGVKEFIFAGSYGNNNPNNDSGNNGVWRSLDAGLSFQKIMTLPLVESGANNHVHALAVSVSNGWLWIPHGDGLNRGIMYSPDALYNPTPTIKVIAEGQFTRGGWQPSSVVTASQGAYFGTDTESGLPNGILGYDLPDKTEISKLGFKAQILDEDARVIIARRGAQVNGSIAYIPCHIDSSCTKIMVTGDGGFSWHLAVTAPFSFEKGMSNPDKDGYVYGPNARFKVTKWDTVTKWVKGRFADKEGYI